MIFQTVEGIKTVCARNWTKRAGNIW